MNLFHKFLTVTLFTACLCACSSNVRHSIGLQRQVPDAFKVVSNPPLTVPPDFHLAPPQPGTPNPGENITEQAEQVVLGTSLGASPGISSADRVLLSRARTSDADPAIVSILNADEQEKLRRKQEKSVWQHVIDKISLKEETDPTINASKEKERIVKNQQEGKPVNAGTTPEIDQSSSGGFLNRILGL